jgi:integrase/recombinase XerD
LALRVTDYQTRGRRAWLRLQEKGGQTIDLPCHHTLENYLDAYLAALSPTEDRRAFLFRSLASRSSSAGLSERPLDESNVWIMVNARARKAGTSRNHNAKID